MLYCDDNIGEMDNSVTSADITVNVDDVPSADQVDLLGKVKTGTAGSEVYSIVGASAPYVGFGYVSVKRKPGGGVSYQGNWFYKVQFSMPDEANKTKGEKIEFQTPTIKGKAMMVNIDATGVPKLKDENEKDFGEAVGYTQQTYSNRATDQHAANESAIAQLQSEIDDWNAALASGKLSAVETKTTADNLKKAKKDMTDIFTADEKVDTQVFAQQQAELQKLFDGMAKSNPEAAEALQNYATLRDQYVQFIQSLSSDEGLDVSEKKALLTPENLKKYLGLDISQDEINQMFADPENIDMPMCLEHGWSLWRESRTGIR